MKDYQADDLYEAVLRCDAVFLYDVPIKERTELIEYCYRNKMCIRDSPKGIRTGIILSVGSVIIFAGWIFTERRKDRNR